MAGARNACPGISKVSFQTHIQEANSHSGMSSLIPCTAELRFLDPPWETKIGSRNRELRNIGSKITVKTSPRETTFGSRNRGSTVLETEFT